MVSCYHQPVFFEWSGLGLTICVCTTSFMIINFSCDIFSYGTWIFVYVLIHVMYLCVYVNMICQQCMLYDDMYLQDNYKKHPKPPSLAFTSKRNYYVNGSWHFNP
jgi:hypothetical protein